MKEFDCSPRQWNKVLFYYPGIPPDSILLATVTSVDQTSNCHLFCPSTPPSTVPVWTPTRMSTSVLVFSRTYLEQEGKQRISVVSLKWDENFSLDCPSCLLGFFHIHKVQLPNFESEIPLTRWRPPSLDPSLWSRRRGPLWSQEDHRCNSNSLLGS